MYKNVVFLIFDALTDKNNFEDKFDILKKYKENIIYFDNIYSQAPFTEAAISALLSGKNILDNRKGYFHNLDGYGENFFTFMKKNGYKVTSTIWNYANTESFFSGVDSYYYMEIIDLNYVVQYRLKDLRNLDLNNIELDKYTYEMEILLDNFIKTSERFIEDFKKKSESLELILNIYELDNNFIDSYVLKLENLKKLYLKDKKKYIKDLINGKLELPIFNEKKSYIKKTYYKNISIKNKVLSKSMKVFIKNILNKDIRSYFYKKIRNSNSKLKWNIINVMNMIPIIKYDYPSAGSVISKIEEIISNNTDDRNLIFAHLMDTHFSFNFLTHESNDKDEIKTEIKQLNKIFSKKNHKNPFYAASIGYVNSKVDELIQKLNSIDDTLLIITSDHGNSFTGEQFREVKVNNFFDETYKVPLILFSNKLHEKKINNYGSSKDILKTIGTLINLDYINKNNFNLFNESRKYVLFEYFGPGSPNFLNNDYHLCVRGYRYKISCKINQRKEFSYDDIFEVYDLNIDPQEVNNIKNNISKLALDSEINFLIEKLKKRIHEINIIGNLNYE